MICRTWKDYEIYIANHFKKEFPNANITHNVQQQGILSKVKRQIDILIEQKIAGFDMKIIVDCKYFNKKVDVKIVDSFLGFLQDLKASKGVLITNEGYTDAAKNRAENDTRDIVLEVVNFSDLENYQSFFAIPYTGNYGAFVFAPDGWIADARQWGDSVTSFYPIGLSLEEAYDHEGFMYLSFIVKDENYLNLSISLDKQNAEVKKHYTNCEINYLDTINRNDCDVKLRKITSDEMSNSQTSEYTIFLDYPEVILFITLLSPIKKEKQYLKKLEWIAQKLQPLKIKHEIVSEMLQ